MFWNSKDASIFLSGPDTKTRAQGRTIGSKYFAQRATSLAQHFIPNGSKLKMKTPNGFLGMDQIVPNPSTQLWILKFCFFFASDIKQHFCWSMGLLEARESLTMRIANRRSQRAGSRTSPAKRLCITSDTKLGKSLNRASNHGWNGKKHQEPEAKIQQFSRWVAGGWQNLDASQPANWTNTKPEINDRRADGMNCQTWHSIDWR